MRKPEAAGCGLTGLHGEQQGQVLVDPDASCPDAIALEDVVYATGPGVG